MAIGPAGFDASGRVAAGAGRSPASGAQARMRRSSTRDALNPIRTQGGPKSDNLTALRGELGIGAPVFHQKCRTSAQETGNETGNSVACRCRDLYGAWQTAVVMPIAMGNRQFSQAAGCNRPIPRFVQSIERSVRAANALVLVYA